MNKGLLFGISALLLLGLAAFLAFGLGDDTGAPPGTGPGAAPPPVAAEPASAEALSATAAETSAETPERTEVSADAAAAPTRRIALTGRLVQDGMPVAGVTLEYRGSRILDAQFDVFEDLRDREPDTTETGADGHFLFRVAAGRPGSLSLADEIQVFAGKAHRSFRVAARDEDHDLGDIALDPAAILGGLVQDRAGRPLGDVEVALSNHVDAAMLAGFGQRSTKTDATGRFSFAGLHGTDYRVTTASPNHLPQSEVVSLTTGGRHEDVVLTLDGGALIRGRVIDDLGRPIPGAEVGAYRKREIDGSMTVRGLARGESVEADVAGEFALGGINDESVTVRARADGYQSASLGGVAKGATDVVVRLQRNGALEGRLVDDSGDPIVGSSVRVTTSGSRMVGFSRRSVKTTADGSFRVEGVAPGPVTVSANGDDHVPTEAKSEVQAGETTAGVRLIAARGATVSALVLDQDGQPVAGALVEVAEPKPDSGAGGMTFRSRSVEVESDGHGEDVFIDHGGPAVLGKARTDADGIARIAGLPAGSCEVRASHDELAPAQPVRLSLPASGLTETELSLREGGAIELRVIDVVSAPVANASIRVEGPMMGGDAGEGRTVKSNSDGEATLNALPPGTYTAVLKLPPKARVFGGASIMMAGDDGGALEASRVQFTVEAGQTAQATLTRPTLTTLSGVLSDVSGPVARGQIELAPRGQDGEVNVDPMGSSYSARTDENGLFAVEDIPPGAYTIRYGRKGQTVKGEDEIELHGEAVAERNLFLVGGVIAVQVFDQDGDGLRKAKVTVRREGGDSGARPRVAYAMMVTLDGDGGEQSMSFGPGQPSVYTDEDGAARIEDVPPGRYQVVIEHQRHIERAIDAVEVFANDTVDLGSIELTAGAMVSGRVVDGSGASPMVASVELQRLEGAEPSDPDQTTAMQGSFRFKGLQPGRYRLRARGLAPGEPRPWGEPLEVDLRPGKVERVTVTIP